GLDIPSLEVGINARADKAPIGTAQGAGRVVRPFNNLVKKWIHSQKKSFSTYYSQKLVTSSGMSLNVEIVTCRSDTWESKTETFAERDLGSTGSLAGHGNHGLRQRRSLQSYRMTVFISLIRIPLRMHRGDRETFPRALADGRGQAR